jgi:hypothetical protein
MTIDWPPEGLGCRRRDEHGGNPADHLKCSAAKMRRTDQLPKPSRLNPQE